MTTIFASPRATHTASASLLDIEALLGYRPAASIALYLRRRRKPPAALRVDLAPKACRDPQELARALTGLVARVPGAMSVEVVVYGRESDDQASMRRYVPVVRAIRSRLGAAGFEVPRGFFVVGERWRGADAGGADPWLRLPRGQSGGDATPRVTSGHPPDPHHGAFVPIAPASEHRRARAMAAFGVLAGAVSASGEPEQRESRRGGDGGGGAGGGAGACAVGDADTDADGDEPSDVDVIETLLRWNAVLTAAPGSPLPSDARAVALLWSLRHRVVRDCALMVCAWGIDAGVIALHEAREPAAAAIGAGSVYDTFLGIGARPPAPEGLRSAVDLLRHLVSCAPESIGAPALTMLAWLEWARGRGSVADSYLEACAGVDPEYRLARLLQVMIRHGFVPEWIGAAPDETTADGDRPAATSPRPARSRSLTASSPRAPRSAEAPR